MICQPVEISNMCFILHISATCHFKFAKLRPLWNSNSNNWHPLNFQDCFMGWGQHLQEKCLDIFAFSLLTNTLGNYWHHQVIYLYYFNLGSTQGYKIDILEKKKIFTYKGQLISKCPFGVIVCTKIPKKNLTNFCPRF